MNTKNILIWGGFFTASLLVYYFLSSGDFSFLLVRNHYFERKANKSSNLNFFPFYSRMLHLCAVLDSAC